MDTFIDVKKVTKWFLLIENIPIRVYVPEGLLNNEFKAHMKRGRPWRDKHKERYMKTLHS